MEHNCKYVDWSNYPPLEKCTSFHDINNNKLDIAINDIDIRVVNSNHDSKILY